MKAIVTHYRKKMNDGTYLIVPGPPRKREEFQKVATDTDKILSDSIVEHQDSLKDRMNLRDA